MKSKIFCFFSILFLLFLKHSIYGETTDYSLITIYITDNSLKLNTPINVWFNDSLIISKKGFSAYSFRYKIHSNGNLKITSQKGDLIESKAEYYLNILKDNSYKVIIKFESAKSPGSIYGLRKMIEKDYYEPYYQENIFKFLNTYNDTSFNGEIHEQKDETYSSSAIYLLLENDCNKPIAIYINDKLVMTKDVVSLSSIYCTFFSEGITKISAQIGDIKPTKIEQKIVLKNKEVYYIRIKYSNKKGTISVLDNLEGSKLLESCREKWHISDETDNSLDLIEESLTNPIPKMAKINNDFLIQEQNGNTDSLSIQANKDDNNSFNIKYDYKAAKDMIIREKGDTLFFNKIQYLGIEDDKLKISYINNNDQRINTNILCVDINKVILDIYSDPLINPNIFNKINIEFLILDSSLYKNVYNSLNYSPYMDSCLNEITGRILLNGILGGLVCGVFIGTGTAASGILLIIYGAYIGIPVLIAGLAVDIYGWSRIGKPNQYKRDKIMAKYLKLHQDNLYNRKEKIRNNLVFYNKSN
jgi:hypothetical protein